MVKKNLLIYGWRGINQSVALVNQNQLLCLQEYDNLNIFHIDAPFHNPKWNSKSNDSGFELEKQSLISTPQRPDPQLPLDCIYTATYPFDLFFKNENRRNTNKVLNFIVTEFGLTNADFVSDVGNTKELLRDSDLIITPSNWSKNKIAEFGFSDHKIKVIPHGINPEIYYPSDADYKIQFKKSLGLDRDSFLFFNMGSMTWNKGIDLIVEAFLILRKKYDHIRLLLKDQSNLYGIQSQNIISQIMARKPEINQADYLSSFIVINTNLSLQQLKSIYSCGDCYLSPYRAEGFNLTVLEAMACGTNPIVTEGGSTDDFCTHPSIGKVKSNKLLNKDNKLSNRTDKGYYLEPDLESLIYEMEKKILSNNSINHDMANLVREQYTWQQVTKKLHELMI